MQLSSSDDLTLAMRGQIVPESGRNLGSVGGEHWLPSRTAMRGRDGKGQQPSCPILCGPSWLAVWASAPSYCVTLGNSPAITAGVIFAGSKSLIRKIRRKYFCRVCVYRAWFCSPPILYLGAKTLLKSEHLQTKKFYQIGIFLPTESMCIFRVPFLSLFMLGIFE